MDMGEGSRNIAGREISLLGLVEMVRLVVVETTTLGLFLVAARMDMSTKPFTPTKNFDAPTKK